GTIRTACLPDTGWPAHLHPDMGIVAAPLTAGTAVPAPMVPGKGLIYRPVIPINKPMHTGIIIGRAVPGIDKHGCLGLGTAHRVEHQPLHRNLSPRRITWIFR